MRGWESDQARSRWVAALPLVFCLSSMAHAQQPAVPPAAPAVAPSAAPAAPVAPVAAPAATAATAAPTFVPGEILVQFKQGIEMEKASVSLTTRGLVAIQQFATLGVQRYRLPDGMDVATAVRTLRADPNVAFAEPNYIYRASVLPNDPRFQDLWGLENATDTDIDAPEAWEAQTGAPGIVVAIIDTGVDYNHEDLRANMWRNPGESGGGRETNAQDDDGNGYIDDVFGWDFAADERDPMDDNGHGSHVAGTIAAVGNNRIGVAGVNWQASIMALKFLSADGSGNAADAIEAILYAASNGARVLNNSWGGGAFSQALQEAIEVSRDRNAVFVAAAGNESRDTDRSPNYPSNYGVANILSVAAYDRQGQIAAFSNFGRQTVDLAAPGVEILSALPGNAYGTLSGTSMATPQVSGVVALVLAQNPEQTFRQAMVRVAGGVELTEGFENVTWAGGRLNAASALSDAPKVAFVTRLDNVIDPAGPYPIDAEVVDNGAIQSLVLNYAIGSGVPVSVQMQMQPNGTNRADIPGQAVGTMVSYFVEATDDAANVARSATYTFQVGQPASVPGCGTFSFSTGTSPRDRVLLALFNLFLLGGAVYWARKLVIVHRTVTAAKH